jgi:RNA ligase
VKVKYPRTYHAPWSLGVTNDDKVIKDTSSFIGNEVVLLEKMDGENTTLSRDYIHARSLDSVDHPSRHWVKGIWGQIRHNIPEGYRICGENLFAKHSIEYNDLPSYFMVFNIWDENNVCLSFDETLEWCNLLEIQHVPVLWRGIYDENFIKNFELDFSKQEGYVVRLAKSFHYDDFEKSVMKMVRKGHVQTDSHWMFQKVVPNKLKNI